MSDIVRYDAIPGGDGHDNSCSLPIELWILILSFLAPYEEFPVAQVCRMFHNILTDKRNRRGDANWQTDITPFCRSSRAIQSLRHNINDIRYYPKNQMIVDVLLRERNHATLVSFVDAWMYDINRDGLYKTLLAQKAYDATRALIKKSIRTPIDFIESAVPTGQLDLVKHAHFSYPQFLFGDVSLLNAAIKTANLDVIMFVHEIMKRQYRQFRVSMIECVRTKSLGIVKFCLETFGCNIMWHDSITFALAENLMDIFVFLIENNCTVTDRDKEQIEMQHPELRELLEKCEVFRTSSYYDYDSDW
jgi:hypothetical protein